MPFNKILFPTKELFFVPYNFTKGTSRLVLLQTNIKVKKQTISMLKLY